MRKFKRILAAVTALLMLALTPLSAFAGSGTNDSNGKSEVSRVDITMNSPEWSSVLELGDTIAYYSSYYNFNSTAYIDTDATGHAGYVSPKTNSEGGRNDIKHWYMCPQALYAGNATDWSLMNAGSYIYARTYYRMNMVLTFTDAQKDNCVFAANTTCTINGTSCTVTRNSDTEITIDYIIEPMHYSDDAYKDNYEIIENITSQIVEPKIGALPTNMPTSYSLSPTGEIDSHYIIWRKMSADDYNAMKEWYSKPHDEDETCPYEFRDRQDRLEYETTEEEPYFIYTEKFEEGYAYQAEVCFATDERTYNIFSENLRATINGKTYENEYDANYWYGYDYDPNEAAFYIEFAPLGQSSSDSADKAESPSTADDSSALWFVLALTSGATITLLLSSRKRSIR